MEWDARNVIMTGNSDGVVRVSVYLTLCRGGQGDCVPVLSGLGHNEAAGFESRD